MRRRSSFTFTMFLAIACSDDSSTTLTDSEGEAEAEAEAESEGETLPAEVLRTGTNEYMLVRGTVLTPGGILDPGDVLVNDAGEIACVAANCTTADGASNATWIDTHGIISPGLIDAHNHMSYNFLPEWVPDPSHFFNNRYEWSETDETYASQYEEWILPYSICRSSSRCFCPASKWGELRSLVHGTTTMQGQPSASGNCINWGIRNADGYHGLGPRHMRGNIGSPREITDDYANGLVADYTAVANPITRFHVHMAEGLYSDDLRDDHVDEEFDSFAGRDPRANRHRGLGLLDMEPLGLDYGTAMLIHCVPLTETQLQEVLDTDSMIVWSPSSNMALYDATAPIERILQLEIPTGIGPDWTLSGEDEMLGELRYALSYGERNGIAQITPEKLWEMATVNNAFVVGLHGRIGEIEVGQRGDITVFTPRPGMTIHESIISNRSRDVRLVLIDGKGYYGDAHLEGASARNTLCEAFDACGAPKYICVQDEIGADRMRDQTLEDIRDALLLMLADYSRDDLLPLVDCGS